VDLLLRSLYTHTHTQFFSHPFPPFKPAR